MSTSATERNWKAPAPKGEWLPMLNETAAGLYRKDEWAFVTHNSGARLAMTRKDYEGAGHRPAFDTLQSEDDFNEHALGRRFGDNN